MPPLEYNRCLVCPVRGDCCYFSTLIDEKHNIILEDHPCTFLNTETGLCKDYKNRKTLYPNCMDVDKAKLVGGLPLECLYLKKGEELPYPPKRRLMPEDNERLRTRTEYINAMPHKNFQKNIPEFVHLLSDELEEENTT